MKTSHALSALLLAACSSDAYAPSIDALKLSGELVTPADSVRGVVTMTNRSNRPVSFGVGDAACAVNLHVYNSNGALVWDQQRARPPLPGGCKWIGTEVALFPGDSHRVVTETVTRSAMRSAIGSGAFQARVQVIFARLVEIHEGSYTTVTDSVAEVPAGSLTL